MKTYTFLFCFRYRLEMGGNEVSDILLSHEDMVIKFIIMYGLLILALT